MMRLRLLKVTGNSMYPALTSGAFVLVIRWRAFGWHQRLAVGDMVAVDHPEFGAIVKRVSRLDNDNGGVKFRLCGDNQQASVTEAQIGWINEEQFIGKVVFVAHANGADS